jgi:3-hydroxybutyryl-CoA dehydrogenase
MGAVRRVAVVGAGVMGAEIAQAVAAARMNVVLVDANAEALAHGRAHIEAIGARRVKRGRLSETEASAILSRVATGDGAEAFAECDVAIEAVTERLEVKHAVFADLDAALPPHALLASNTSGLSITALAEGTGRPDRVLGLHFFNPASVMRLVEVIRGSHTSDATVEEGLAFVEALGKTPVVVRECPGFLVNRVLCRALSAAYREAAEGGADRAAADAAVVAAGPAPMGAFALGDLIGLDTLGHILRDLREAYGDRFDDAGTVDAEVSAGRLGAKSGGGLLPEGAGTGDAAPAPEPDDAARAVAAAYYRGARDEAERCLDEGIAARDDIATAMMLGCGWEAGPLEVDPQA